MGCSFGAFSHLAQGVPHYLSDEQISFLMPFFHKLYNLPGGDKPNRELRWCLAFLIRDYPPSLANPMVAYRKFLAEHKLVHKEWLYKGDLEADFLRSLTEIQKEAREKPLGIVIDFRG